MGRVMIKGGVWRNTEDEILKAAVMKYGKNQWSRIASLLHRKSAKQCKARWFEWLDPSIKKTEWSHEEDQKLLHMAKIMPTQWRTISQMIGRTAAQCLERYEALLDQAQKKEEEMETGEDPRKLKPGEIDPNPETKPARPDPKDMDEDELEMLSEARARLANTQGKKAKRKAREKQLEEARRLATLQKRRELRAAGIEYVKRMKKRRAIDYNAEIPFEKKPAPGFYDTSQETVDPFAPDFKRLRQQNLEGEKRSDKEEKERQKDKQKMKQKKENEIPTAMLTNQEPIRKKSKLVLPEPQVSDQDLQQVGKLARLSEVAKEMLIDEDNPQPTDALLSDFATPGTIPFTVGRTPRTPAVATDRVMQEAQNIIALTHVDTPLKGGLNTPLVNPDFGGITPQYQAITTPNTLLATPFSQVSDDGSQFLTPYAVSQRIDKRNPTPLRSKLAIADSSTDESPSPAISTVENIKHYQQQIREEISKEVSRLPAPKNDFEVVVPEEELSIDEDDKQNDIVPDQAEIDAAIEAENEAIRIEALKKRSQVIQRNLPRPCDITVPLRRDSNLSDLQKAEELIKQEMITMLHYDAFQDPVVFDKSVGSKKSDIVSPAQHKAYLEKHPYEEFTQDEMQNATQLLQEEMDYVKERMGHGDISLDVYTQVWEECLAQVLYLPTQNRYTRASLASKKERLDALDKKLEMNRSHMKKERIKADKLEQKLKILHGGYESRSTMLIRQYNDLQDQIEKAHIELSTFKFLQKQEDLAIPRRIQALTEDVERQKEREKTLQKQFADLRQALTQLEND